MATDSNDALLPLADVVHELRAQILLAAEGARDQDLRFKLNTVEIELSVVAKRELGGEGKISFKVLGTGVEAGGGGKSAHEHSQKIKLSLTPHRRDGGELNISRVPAPGTEDAPAAPPRRMPDSP